MRTLILWLMLVVPTSVQAEFPALYQPEFPALYDVTDVEANDVLNVRKAPTSSAPIIGTFAPTATGIEVIEADGNWALVNVGEISGWTSLTYLTAQYVDDTSSLTNRPLTCFGTEPFWSYAHASSGTSTFEYVGEPIRSYERSALHHPTSFMPGQWVFFLQGYIRLTGFVKEESCNDGMSDRAFGLSVTLLVEEDVAIPYLLNGCCSLASAN